MKRILAIVLTMGLLLSGGTALAANNSVAQGVKTQVMGSTAWKEHKAELQALTGTVKQNRQEIVRLRDDAREKLKQVKAVLQELKKDSNSLNEDKIARIKETLTLIRDDRVNITGTVGKIFEQKLDLRVSKRNRDWQGVLDSIKGIIDVQQERIDTLKKLNADLDALLADLKPAV